MNKAGQGSQSEDDIKEVSEWSGVVSMAMAAAVHRAGSEQGGSG